MLNTANLKKRLIRNRRLHRQAGMTLIEIMIVVIIMAMIATGVALAVLPQMERARENDSRTRAATIRGGVEMYLSFTPGADCPSVQDLLDEEIIAANTNPKDGWDRDFAIECEGNNISVLSAGSDGEFGTEDDIQ